jgi:SNF2 family DNA or RNA helicase
LFLVNYDGLKWLVGRLQKMKVFPFDMLVLDESSYIKATNTLRYKLLKSIAKLFRRRYVLTGDPAPNSLLDLFGQVYIMDLGATFTPYITRYRMDYFVPTGYGGYTWVPQKDAEPRIRTALAPRAYTLTEEDQRGLPAITYNTIKFQLPKNIMAAYAELKANLRLQFSDGSKITGANMGVIINKLQQFTGGAVYTSDDEEGTWLPIHDEKLLALQDLINERQGRPTVVVYRYKHELIRLRELFGKNTPSFADKRKVADLQDDWNAGNIPVLLAQERSMSHGLNMQKTEGHIVWFYLTTSNETYRQLVRRIYRTGQKHPVVVHHLVAQGTWDERAMAIVTSKQANQAAFLAGLRQYWLL